MFTSMVDETTLEINGESFEIGDEIELVEEEKVLLRSIRDLNKSRDELQQLLITAVHLAEKNIVSEIREPAHEINAVSLDLSYYLNRLLHNIQTRLGGQIPLDFRDNYTKIVVRMKKPGEPLNYTVQSVKQSLGFARFETIRDIGIALAGNKSGVRFDLTKNTKLDFQPVDIDVTKGVTTIEAIVSHLSDILKEKPGIQGMLFIIDCPTGDEHMTYAIPVDDRRPDRTEKMVKFGKAAKAEAICVVQRGGAVKDVLTVTVAFMAAGTKDKSGMKKTVILEVALASREVSIKEEKKEFTIPNGDTYARIVER